jgi:hypothetical protein
MNININLAFRDFLDISADQKQGLEDYYSLMFSSRKKPIQTW